MGKEEREYGVWANDDKIDQQYKKSKGYQNEMEKNYADSSDENDDEMLMRTGFSLNVPSSSNKGQDAGRAKSKFVNFVSGGIKAATLKKDTQIVFDPKEEARLAEEKRQQKIKENEEKGITLIDGEDDVSKPAD